jgi:hypothetical protein
MHQKSHLILGALVVASAFGCSRSGFDVAPVHGTVTADDKPLFQGRVMFAPSAKGENMEPGKPAWGDIDKNGNYRLSTFTSNDGAVIGEHWVTVINSGEDLPDDVPEFSRIVLPKRMAVVAGKDNQLDIKLTSKTIKENREDDR